MGDNSSIGLSDTHGLIGNPIEFFNSLPYDVQKWIVWFITGLAFVFLIITVAAMFGHGIGASTASIQRDSSGRGRHIIGICSGVVTVVLVIVAVALIFGIYA